MVFKSNITELLENNIDIKIESGSKIYKLQDTSVEAVAFVVLPPNGGKPIKLQGDFPKELFDRDFVTVIERYYQYPDDLVFEDDELTSLYQEGPYTKREKRRKEYALVNVVITSTITIIFAFALFLAYFLLRSLPEVSIFIIGLYVVIMFFIWYPGGGSIER
jgi:hypothetical protein